MSTAAATTSDRAAQPESSRAWARASATLNAVAIAVLAALVFDRIEHGRPLAVMFRRHVREPGYGLIGRLSGTGYIRVIGRCMRSGAMRRLALSHAVLYKLLRHSAACSLALCLPRLRRDHTRREQGSANACAGTAANDEAAASAPATSTWPNSLRDHDISYRPAEAEGAGAACHHTARAVLPGICRDFDATAESAGTLRDGLLLVPTARSGGSLTQFIAEVDRRKAPASRIETPRFGAPPERRHLDCLLAEEQSCACAPPQQAPAECSSPEAEPCTAAGEPFERTETGPAMRCPVSSAQEVAGTAKP